MQMHRQPQHQLLSVSDKEFWDDPEVTAILLCLHADEHNPMRRSSCFKKGPECRFNFGKRSCLEASLGIEDEADDGSNVTT